MLHRIDDAGRERDPQPLPHSGSSFWWRLPYYVVGLVVLGFAVFLAVVVTYDGGCTEAAECEGDGELAIWGGFVYGFVASCLGVVVIAMAEGACFLPTTLCELGRPSPTGIRRPSRGRAS